MIYLIAITSLWIASKYNSTEPLLLDEIFEDLGHKEYSQDRIESMERRILYTIKLIMHETYIISINYPALNKSYSHMKLHSSKLTWKNEFYLLLWKTRKFKFRTVFFQHIKHFLSRSYLEYNAGIFLNNFYGNPDLKYVLKVFKLNGKCVNTKHPCICI